ncbi:MAG TPA: hypothetical protein VFX65_11090 [Candidatus Limnocylindrales bacterium]|nr:hypothetical protein [Candidatus Limnocylindrales bacterium]
MIVGFAAVSVLAALLGLLLICGLLGHLGIEDTWGNPGTEAYLRYERFNRVMAVILGLEALCLPAFAFANRSMFGRSHAAWLTIAVAGWLGMAVATAAEFWFFSGLAYETGNARDVAFTAFGIAGLVLLAGVVLLGVSLLRRRAVPPVAAVALLAFPLLDVASYLAGMSIFLPVTILALAVGLFTITRARRGD